MNQQDQGKVITCRVSRHLYHDDAFLYVITGTVLGDKLAGAQIICALHTVVNGQSKNEKPFISQVMIASDLSFKFNITGVPKGTDLTAKIGSPNNLFPAVIIDEKTMKGVKTSTALIDPASVRGPAPDAPGGFGDTTATKMTVDSMELAKKPIARGNPPEVSDPFFLKSGVDPRPVDEQVRAVAAMSTGVFPPPVDEPPDPFQADTVQSTSNPAALDLHAAIADDDEQFGLGATAVDDTTTVEAQAEFRQQGEPPDVDNSANESVFAETKTPIPLEDTSPGRPPATRRPADEAEAEIALPATEPPPTRLEPPPTPRIAPIQANDDDVPFANADDVVESPRPRRPDQQPNARPIRPLATGTSARRSLRDVIVTVTEGDEMENWLKRHTLTATFTLLIFMIVGSWVMNFHVASTMKGVVETARASALPEVVAPTLPPPIAEVAPPTPAATTEDSGTADEDEGNTLDFPGFLKLTTNATCSHWDRGLGVEVEETTDFDFDPGKNTRMYIVKCEGYSKPLMTPLDDLSEGVPRSSLLEAPPLP